LCIFLFSLNFEHNLEDYVWDSKCILMHAWLHLPVPRTPPTCAGCWGTGGLQGCDAGTATAAPKTLAQRSVDCKIPSYLIKCSSLMIKGV